MRVNGNGKPGELIKIGFMTNKKSNNKIEKLRKNNKFLKLFESIPYNNSKVGQSFVMKVSSKKKPKDS